MIQSNTIKELATALTKAQSEFPAVPFNAENPFLKNKYADLGAVIETARPVLAKNGLSFTQLVTSNTATIGVVTMLMHSSGEYIGAIAELPLGEERGKSQAQVAGSVITYLRRYALASMLGLYADEDTDGQPHTPAPKNVSQPETPAKDTTFVKNEAVKHEPVPAGNGKMTIEEAEAVENSTGMKYGAVPTETLQKWVAKMEKDGNPEHDHKIAAARLIMAERGNGRKVQTT